MKKVSVILCAALIALTGCSKRDLSSINTRLDNLENGLENANGRISTIEETIASINAEIASLQYLKAGVVISNVSGSDAAGWKITFADGKVVNVYPKDDSGKIPVVGISGDGYWTVDYGDGSGPQYLRDAANGRIPAQSNPGAQGRDGIVPVLGADADGYWIVSYDEGKTFSRLLDDKGNPVKAKLSVGDSIFSGVVSDGSKVTFTLNSGASFSCPIVPDFFCAIKDVTGEVEFQQGETKNFQLEMRGISNAIVVCPEGWSATLEGTALAVTAPAATKASAISFSSNSSVAVLATSGIGYSVITSMKVKLFVPDPVHDTWYEDWTINGRITVDDVVINKSDFGDGVLLENGGEITGGGVYFVKEGATVTYTTVWAERFKCNTLIIGNSKTSRSALRLVGTNGNFYLSNNISFVLKNIDVTVESNSQPLFMLNATYTNPLFMVDNCHIKCNGNAFFMSNAKMKFGAVYITNSEFRVNSDNSYLGTHGKVDKARILNNIFYSKDAHIFTVVPLYSEEECMDMVVSDNTLINVYRPGNGMFTGSVPNARKDDFRPILSNNLRYYCSATPAGTLGLGHWTLVADEGGTWYSWNREEVGQDHVYVEGGNTNSSAFRSLYNPAVNSDMLSSCPFSALDYTNGTFTNTTAYGAKR